jgi:putative transposase
MRKLKDKRKLLWCLKQYHKGKESQKWLAAHLGISNRHFRRLYTTYKHTLQVPKPKTGRPKKQTPPQWNDLVTDAWNKHHLNAVYLEKILWIEQKQKIPHNIIHKIMLANGYACEQASKQKRRKPWIRYERDHSLSAVHMDWHVSKAVSGMQVCVVLDDASRKILAGGEFSNATSENSVLLLKEALYNCQDSYNLHIRECISDHGTQFYGVRRDKQGCAEHTFEVFLREEGVVQLLCGVNHPQTNGKVEKWFDFYEHHRGRFDSFDELISWYNGRMHGSLNMRYAETPNQAFIRKLPPEVWMWQANKLLNGEYL